MAKTGAKHSPKVSGGVEFYARNMTFGAGVFVAVGDHGIYASSDGIAWDLVVDGALESRVFPRRRVPHHYEDQTAYQRSTDGTQLEHARRAGHHESRRP